MTTHTPPNRRFGVSRATRSTPIERDGFLIVRNVFASAEIAELDRDARCWLVGTT